MPQERQPDDPAAALAAHAAMVAQLRRPGACAGHAGAAELIETHISSLLVAGDHVYKLKKPVVLPFVDFSTLAQRWAACQQELRLNRRTAPQWYLEVVPVQQSDSGAVIVAPGGATDRASAGAVIDWAVRMQRFDDRGRFDRLADAGVLGVAQIDRLVEVVAGFHAAQPPWAGDGDPAAAAVQGARDNALELARCVEGTPLASSVSALQRWSAAPAAEVAACMAQRAHEGHVRDVHGDLHLGNIVWADGTAVLFDALEFSDTMRCIDTVGDLAFTFMDLLAHGLPRLAWRFVGGVLEAGGDWGALPLLRWWAVHRAAVRAKVALLTPTATGRLGAAQAQARRYLDVAAALTAPPPPRLLLLMGLSGSGKTAVAGVLAECLGGVRLRSDVERKRLFGLAPTARPAPAQDLYGADATHRTYERLQALAEAALRAGVPVVVDAASLRRTERDALRALARRLGLPFHLVCCEAPLPVLQDRLRRRLADGRDASDATLDVLVHQQQFAEWPAGDEADDLLRIDTDNPWPTLDRAVAQLASQLVAG